LILRLATGLSLAAAAHMAGDLADTASALARYVVGGVAVLIWIGLWTPLAAVAAAAIQIIVIILGHQFNLLLLVFVALGLSLAMLGPGAWSFDARLFGRTKALAALAHSGKSPVAGPLTTCEDLRIHTYSIIAHADGEIGIAKSDFALNMAGLCIRAHDG
jgi:putative oxidoreductase